MNIDIDQLASAIVDELVNYSEEITDNVKEAVNVVANECNQEIKKHIIFEQPSGDYVKAFRIKDTYQDRYGKVKTWFVSGDQYRLTHLLENGHLTRNGSRTRAFEHIKYGEALAQARMAELAEEAIEKAGRS